MITTFEQFGLILKNFGALALEMFAALAAAGSAAMQGDWIGVGNADQRRTHDRESSARFVHLRQRSKMGAVRSFVQQVYGAPKLPSADDVLHDLAQHGGRYDRSGPPPAPAPGPPDVRTLSPSW